MPVNILNLPSYHVTKITKNEQGYHIDAESKGAEGTLLSIFLLALKQSKEFLGGPITPILFFPSLLVHSDQL